MEDKKRYEIKQYGFKTQNSQKLNNSKINYSSNNIPPKIQSLKEKPQNKKIKNRISIIFKPQQTIQVIENSHCRRRSNNNHQFISSFSGKIAQQENGNIKEYKKVSTDPSISLRKNKSSIISNDTYRTQSNTPTPVPTIQYNKHKENKNKTINQNLVDRKKIKTPQYHSNVIIKNNLTYYLRCPYCHHALNEDLGTEKNIEQIKQINNKKEEEYKENRNPNISKNSINNAYDTYSRKNKNIKIQKIEPKNFYINEKGVTVFKPIERPSLFVETIVKPDFSKYHNETNYFGHNKNIGIYVAPVPQKKVFIRPLIV